MRPPFIGGHINAQSRALQECLLDGSPNTLRDGLHSYDAAMRELGNSGKREWAAGPTTALRTAISRSDDETGHAPVPEDENTPGFRLDPSLLPQPLQPGTHLTNRETFNANRSAASAE